MALTFRKRQGIISSLLEHSVRGSKSDWQELCIVERRGERKTFSSSQHDRYWLL